jgi:hypothetical protein
MKYRKLRIAWSVGWGIVCLLLILLWISDYRQSEDLSAVPYAFLLLIAAGLVALSWVEGNFRFGLRSLLIATTVVAVLLGLVVWTAR